MASAFDARPAWVPLEVGYTRAEPHPRHLLNEGAVAHWPYDEEVHLLVDPEWGGLFMGGHPLPADVEPVRVTSPREYARPDRTGWRQV